MAALIEQVRAYALERYEAGGWDVVVECWDDEFLALAIGKARTLRGAVRKIAPIVSVYADRQADARNSAF